MRVTPASRAAWIVAIDRALIGPSLDRHRHAAEADRGDRTGADGTLLHDGASSCRWVAIHTRRRILEVQQLLVMRLQKPVVLNGSASDGVPRRARGRAAVHPGRRGLRGVAVGPLGRDPQPRGRARHHAVRPHDAPGRADGCRAWRCCRSPARCSRSPPPARDAVVQATRELVGQLRVGSEQCLGIVDVASLLERFRRRYPRVEIAVHPGGLARARRPGCATATSTSRSSRATDHVAC